MTMPRKGSRPIVVEGQPYRWRVRRKPTLGQVEGFSPLSISVECLTKPHTAPGSVLLLDTERGRFDAWYVPNDRSLPVLASKAATPREVADGIREALKKGWRPNCPGGTFHLEIGRPRKDADTGTAQ